MIISIVRIYKYSRYLIRVLFRFSERNCIFAVDWQLQSSGLGCLPVGKGLKIFLNSFFVTLMYMSEINEGLRSVRINGFSKFAIKV